MAKTDLEKYTIIKSSFLEDIIPSIRSVYEKSSKMRETFIVAHCAILGLSGFYAGSKDTGGSTYIKFVTDFFPSGYIATSLWKDLRNGLIHGYTFMRTYVLADKHPNNHFTVIKNIPNERTGTLSDLTILNLENFIQDLEQAATRYFDRVYKEPALLHNLSVRYDFAPPVIYIKDSEIPTNSILGNVKSTGK